MRNLLLTAVMVFSGCATPTTKEIEVARERPVEVSEPSNCPSPKVYGIPLGKVAFVHIAVMKTAMKHCERKNQCLKSLTYIKSRHHYNAICG